MTSVQAQVPTLRLWKSVFTASHSVHVIKQHTVKHRSVQKSKVQGGREQWPNEDYDEVGHVSKI
jgi:hypothetical protein